MRVGLLASCLHLANRRLAHENTSVVVGKSIRNAFSVILRVCATAVDRLIKDVCVCVRRVVSCRVTRPHRLLLCLSSSCGMSERIQLVHTSSHQRMTAESFPFRPCRQLLLISTLPPLQELVDGAGGEALGRVPGRERPGPRLLPSCSPPSQKQASEEDRGGVTRGQARREPGGGARRQTEHTNRGRIRREDGRLELKPFRV